MNITNKLKAGSTIVVIMITILIMTILGLVIYIMVDKELVNISFNINNKKEDNVKLNEQNIHNFDIEDEIDIPQNIDIEEESEKTIKEDVIIYGHGNFAYLNNGEIYIGSYPKNDSKKITDTDGRVTDFFISPNNNKIVFTTGEQITISDEYEQYFNQLTQQSGKGNLFPARTYNTELFELDLQTGKTVELLSKLNTEHYMADLLLKSVEGRTIGAYADIALMGYDNTGKYIIYSRDDDIAYDATIQNFTKSEGATYIYDVNTKNTKGIDGVYYASRADWSKDNDHIILIEDVSTLHSSFLVSFGGMNDIDLIEQIIESSSGNLFSFKKGTNIAVSDGQIRPADGSFNYEDVYMEMELDNYEIISYKKQGDNFDIVNEDVLVEGNDMVIVAQKDSYKPIGIHDQKYIYKMGDEHFILFEKENSELSEFDNVYTAELDMAFNTDESKPQLISITDNSSFERLESRIMKIYDSFSASEPIEISVVPGKYNFASKLKFFTDESGVVVGE